jgi:thioredoxin-dependent peroxiredoxin
MRRHPRSLWLSFSLVAAAACASSSSSSAPEAKTPATATGTGSSPSSAPPPAATAYQAPATPAATGLLPEGAPAPDLVSPAHDGTTVNLKAWKGHPVVVYFYPKDDTSGCTMEAKAFRDGIAEIKQAGGAIVGVSEDTMDSHKAFAQKYELNFPLVPDTDGKIADMFGVDHSKGFAKRVTFVIGADGKVFRVWPKVSVDGHAQEVIAAVKAAAGKG